MKSRRPQQSKEKRNTNDRTKWSNQLDNELLEMVLKSQTKTIFERNLAKFAKEHFVGKADYHGMRDGDPVRRRIWGLSVRRMEYVADPSIRTSREGQDWSWAELKILNWAFYKETPKECKGKPEPDIAYVAALLQRNEEEIKDKRGMPNARRAGLDSI